jgi:hypothetical protein
MPLSAKQNSFLYKLPEINETINFIKIIGSNATTEVIDSNATPFEIKKKETGLSELLKNEIQVYPNPVNGSELFIITNFIGGEEEVLKVYSLYGELIQSQSISTGQTTLPIAYLKNGVYLISIEVENERLYQKRIIVNRQ